VTNGSCADIPAGSDPDDECAADSAGCASGSCNGLGECDVSFSGTPCNDGNQCSDTDRCDGAGNCQQQTGNGCEEGDACVQEGTVCEPN
jgi:hypothetical protein